MTSDGPTSAPRSQRRHGGVETAELLEAWVGGDDEAAAELMHRIYPQLKHVAGRLLARERGATIQATELVHEAYLRMEQVDRLTWRDREHFLAFSARLMRRILVDLARRKRAHKRGLGGARLDLAEIVLAVEPDVHPDLLTLHRLLDELAVEDPVAASLVELRYFGGLTIDEATSALGLGRSSTVKLWKYARAWLLRALEPAATTPGAGAGGPAS